MDEEEVLEGEEKKGGGKKYIIILVLLVVVLAGTAVALRFLAPGTIPGWGEKKNAGDADATSDTPQTAPEELGLLYPLPSFVVNLVDPSGKRYLKLTLSLELENEKLKEEVDNRLPRLQDGILVLLSTKSFADISTLEGKRRLRMEIINRINAILKTGKVKSVFFSEFVIQ
jgi:flagellar FliL protein